MGCPLGPKPMFMGLSSSRDTVGVVDHKMARIPAKHPNDEFVGLLMVVVVERIMTVVKVRMDMPSQDFCGITWKEFSFLKIEKDGKPINPNLAPETTEQSTSDLITSLGLPLETTGFHWKK